MQCVYIVPSLQYFRMYKDQKTDVSVLQYPPAVVELFKVMYIET